MKRKLPFLFCGLIALNFSCPGEEVKPWGVGDVPDHPKLPGVPWVIHDGTRPQPRKVSTQGALSIPAPGDARVLFDGTNTDAFDGDWPIRDGALIASKIEGKKELRTKESFGKVQLHLEWRIPQGREVNGQDGANSGVFFMDLYEVQINESFANKTYPDGQAAAIYGQYPPLVNASVPQGEWQSYDITFEPPVYKNGELARAALVTVIHNGVVVHNARTILGPTKWRELAAYPKEHPEKGPIALQYHNDPIEFRNIWVRELGEYDSEEPTPRNQ